jgi:hypothetical protein
MRFCGKLLLATIAGPYLLGMLGGCTMLRYGWLSDEQARRLPLVIPGKKLPGSVHSAWVSEDKWMEHTQTISFEASLVDARTFARTILQDRVVVGGDSGVLVHAEQDGWTDAKSASVETGSGFPDGYRVEVAVVPAGEDSRVWLYISSR